MDDVDPPIDVLLDVLDGLDLGPAPLVVGTAEAALLAALRRHGTAPVVWVRRLSAIRIARPDGAQTPRLDAAPAPTPWPAPPALGYCTSALIRLPKSKDELAFLLDAAAAVVAPGGPIVVTGANAEGVRSAAKLLDTVAENVETIATRAHCRVLRASRRLSLASAVGTLAGWRRVGTIDLGDGARAWVSYPGLFAGGRLDDGTRLLLDALPPVVVGARVLDFAAGTGTISAAIIQRQPTAAVTMLDDDALAVLAAGENVPTARAVIGAGLGDADGSFHLIVSNPPVHDGIAEDHAVLRALVGDAPARLAAGGSLVLVVQRRIPVRALLEAAFGSVGKLADDGRFSVWTATAPRPAFSRQPRPRR